VNGGWLYTPVERSSCASNLNDIITVLHWQLNSKWQSRSVRVPVRPFVVSALTKWNGTGHTQLPIAITFASEYWSTESRTDWTACPNPMSDGKASSIISWRSARFSLSSSEAYQSTYRAWPAYLDFRVLLIYLRSDQMAEIGYHLELRRDSQVAPKIRVQYRRIFEITKLEDFSISQITIKSLR